MWYRVVHDPDDATTDQPLVLDEREVGLDACRVAIHHETDGARWRQHGNLRVLVSVLFALRQRTIPSSLRRVEERRVNVFSRDPLQSIAMHSTYPSHPTTILDITCQRAQSLLPVRY